MKIEKIQVFGFEASLRGMRNAYDSWDKGDSFFGENSGWGAMPIDPPWGHYDTAPELPEIGPNDLKLALQLIKRGAPHRKFLRQIIIWVDLTLPRYVWTEMDTQKVGTVRLSCSTMHTLGKCLLVQEDFEEPLTEETLDELNALVAAFQREGVPAETKKLHRKIKNHLPEGFLQKSTFMMSYEVALSILKWRHKHQLPEWNYKNPNSICSFILRLPYMKDFAMAALEGALISLDRREDSVDNGLDSDSPS